VKRSYLIAAGIVVLVTLWMLLGPVEKEGAAMPEAAETASARTQVQAKVFEASEMLREMSIYGQSEPKRRVTVRAEVAGRVSEVNIPRGAAVQKGDLLLHLSEDDRPQRLEQARAALQQRELEYEGAKSLKNKGLQAERQLAEALALLRAARAELKRAELNLQHTRVVAPFGGVLQARHVEVGDYLSVGDPLAEVVELDPMLISGNVSESEVGELRLGMAARAELSNGTILEGTISYIAPSADASTRTYRIEMQAANPPPHQRGGMSASIRIPRDAVAAHKVSPALLSLDDAGVLGIKSVDEDGTVRFYPVEILKSERDGLWLGGLPASLALITVGQGFVRAGDHVDVVLAQ